MLSNKLRKIVTFTLIMLVTILPTINVQATTDNNKNLTGLKENTKEERVKQFKNGIHPTNIKLNKIGANRIYGDNFEKLSIGNDIVEIGDEFETNKSKTNLSNYNLPSNVDNSATKYFPEIGNQGGLNSCSSWATTYYNMTYMTALKNNYSVKDSSGKNISSKVFSPRWTYSLVNNGHNSGTTASENLEILKSHGAASLKSFPYIGDGANTDSYRAWPTDKNIWKESTQFTIKDYGLIDANPKNESTYITSNDDSDLNMIKMALTNGYLLNFYSYAYDPIVTKIKDNPSSTADNMYINESVITAVSKRGAHELTIVGYNDDIWVDINNNNNIDNGELGAFKIANSWGKSSYNNGFYWLAYDSLNSISSVEHFDSSINRGSSINGGLVEFLIPETIKKPSNLLEITIDHNYRNDILVEIGIYDNGRFKSIFYPIFSRNGGEFSFSGDNKNEEATFYINLDYITKMLGLKISDKSEFGIILSDSNSNDNPLTIKNVSLVNYNEWIIDSAKIDKPISIDGFFSEFSLKYGDKITPPSLKSAYINTKDVVSSTGNFEINIKLPENNPRANKLTLYQNDTAIYSDILLPSSSLNRTIPINNLIDGLYSYVAIIEDFNGNKIESNLLQVNVNTTLLEDTFDPTKIYNTGDIVIYKGVKYKAKYWTQGETPDTSPAWERVIDLNPDGSKPYIPGMSYSTGDIVSYEGNLYKANWWTNTVPGSDSSWTLIN